MRIASMLGVAALVALQNTGGLVVEADEEWFEREKAPPPPTPVKPNPPGKLGKESRQARRARERREAKSLSRPSPVPEEEK